MMNVRSIPWATVGLVLLSVGCGGESPELMDVFDPNEFTSNPMVPQGAYACTVGTQQSCGCANGIIGHATCLDSGFLSFCNCDPNAQAQAQAQQSDNTAGGAGSSAGVPCAVTEVTEQHCGGCHGATPQFTAPMSLVSWDDFQAPTPSNPSVPVYQTVLERIQAVQRPMPPTPNPMLDQGQVGVFANWVNGGAQRSAEVCDTAGGGAGSGAVEEPMDVTQQPEDVQCFEFLANTGGNLQQKYNVPTTPDYYHCFNFANPFSGNVQGISTRTIIDNPEVIHHWILYTASGVNSTDGGSGCSGAHPGGQFVAGWAPGAEDIVLPDDVGMQLPNGGYQLEVHYNAPAPGHTDASGLELCATTKTRAHTSAVHPLGAENFATSGAGDVVGTCRPRGPFPINILFSSPHMHVKGTWLKTIIHRAAGGTEMLVDSAFAFDSQLAYPTPTQINEGDWLETTCTYNGPVRFGSGTTDEMCYNFVTAYPAGTLSSGGLQLTNALNCLEGLGL